MADIPMKSIQWPGLPDRYTFLQKASSLTDSDAGKAADAAVVGEALEQLQAGYVAADEVLDQRIDQLEAEIDTDSGEAPALVAGTAEQLMSTTGTVNPTPYTYRANTSGSDRVTVQQITGGTVAFNQLASMTPGSATSKGITRTVNADGTVSFSGTADSAYTWNIQSSSRTGVAGHVILLRGCPSGGSTEGYRLQDGSNTTASRDFGDGRIYAVTHSEGKTAAQIAISDGATVTNVVFTPQYYDLTQMFGATVAQHFLDLETATAGAGVALFRQMFPESYYPYNTGELVSVQTSGRKSGGHTYPLDGTLTLRGVPVMTGGVPAYDGDQYAPTGAVTRRYGIVDLGTLTWSRGQIANSENYRFAATVTGIKGSTTNYLISGGLYTQVTATSGLAGADMTSLCGSNGFYLRNDAYSTGADFKTAMSGVYLVYELATPTTETAAPYQEIQIAGSTEEFLPPATDTRAAAVPVGSVSLYQTNLREGLEKVLGTLNGADPAHAESIAPVQGTTASTNIASGELLMQDGKLYKATQAIVAGAEVTPGTNVSQTSVASTLTQTAGSITYTTQSYVNNAIAASSWVRSFPFGLAFLRLFVPVTSALPTDGTKVAVATVSPAPSVAVYTAGVCNTADGMGEIEIEITTAGVINVSTRGVSKPSSGWGNYNVLIPYITA